MYDAIAVQVLGTRWTKLLVVRDSLALASWRAGQQRKHDGDLAATMAMDGKISAPLVGSAPCLTSKASAAVNLPIVWRAAKNKPAVKN